MGACKLAASDLSTISSNYKCQAALLLHSGQRAAHTAHKARPLTPIACDSTALPSPQLLVEDPPQSTRATDTETCCDDPPGSNNVSVEQPHVSIQRTVMPQHCQGKMQEECASLNASKDDKPGVDSSKAQRMCNDAGEPEPAEVLHAGVAKKLTAWGASAADAAQATLSAAQASEAAAERAHHQGLKGTERVVFCTNCAQVHSDRLSCVVEAVQLLEGFIQCMHDREKTRKEVRVLCRWT